MDFVPVLCIIFSCMKPCELSFDLSLKLNILFLFFSYLESAQSLAKETNIDVTKFEVCDNIDLDTIVMEYESYYYVKFAKYPKITKKLTQSGKTGFMRRLCTNQPKLQLLVFAANSTIPFKYIYNPQNIIANKLVEKIFRE